ncbi:MAG: inner rane transporter permease protein YdcV [Pseudomonadota bacterium]|jgi:spermidine/putrescine transport system permease protein
MTLGYLDRVFRFFSALAFGLIYIPIISLVSSAFFIPSSDDYSQKTFSLEGFTSALSHHELQSALLNSVQLAAMTAVFTTLLAFVLAYGLQGKSERFVEICQQIFSLPLMIPEIIIGLSLLIWFVLVNITLGPISLLISHVSFTLPYAVLLLTLGLQQIETSLFEAGKDLGASKRVIFQKITLPLLKPSLVAVFLLCFVISFDDFLISYFTNGPGNETLPVKLYSLMRFGMSPELKAISTIILAISLVVTLLLFNLLPQKVSKKEV